MLIMKPNCECCDRDLDPSGSGARICSFECTWCVDCADHQGGTCPNCGGSLVPRPPRDAALLEAFPASAERAPASLACP
ncbi:MAG: DUF1272 domain-containing protein [Actinobacteria bacterium]|nr:DUF1272 domain-containing protein [Actinomycetota bacterium]